MLFRPFANPCGCGCGCGCRRAAGTQADRQLSFVSSERPISAPPRLNFLPRATRLSRPRPRWRSRSRSRRPPRSPRCVRRRSRVSSVFYSLLGFSPKHFTRLHSRVSLVAYLREFKSQYHSQSPNIQIWEERRVDVVFCDAEVRVSVCVSQLLPPSRPIRENCRRFSDILMSSYASLGTILARQNESHRVPFSRMCLLLCWRVPVCAARCALCALHMFSCLWGFAEFEPPVCSVLTRIRSVSTLNCSSPLQWRKHNGTKCPMGHWVQHVLRMHHWRREETSSWALALERTTGAASCRSGSVSGRQCRLCAGCECESECECECDCVQTSSCWRRANAISTPSGTPARATRPRSTSSSASRPSAPVLNVYVHENVRSNVRLRVRRVSRSMCAMCVCARRLIRARDARRAQSQPATVLRPQDPRQS